MGMGDTTEQPRPFRMMTVGSETKLSVCSDLNLHRQLSVESEEEEEGDNGHDDVPLVPDGGWGWVVVIAGFMVHFLLDGINYTFGIMMPSIVEDFGSDPGTVVWAGSLLVGVNMLTGPLVGGLVNKFGCRSVAIAGSLIGSASLALSTLCSNVIVFILIYGVVGGLGFGMVFLPAIVCVGMYFEQRRALATGIAVCGAGVGAFVFAPIANLLVDNLGWRYSNLVFSGLCLLNILCGLAMRPLEAVIESTVPDEAGDTVTSAVERKKSTAILQNVDHLPTIGENEVFDEDGDDYEDQVSSNNNSPVKSFQQIHRNMSLNMSATQEKLQRNFSQPYLRPVPSNLSMLSSNSRKVSRTSSLVRPMSRADIFYSGSIRHIHDPEMMENDMVGLRSNRTSFVSIGPVNRSKGSFKGSSNSLVLPRSSLILDHYDHSQELQLDTTPRDEEDSSMMKIIKTMVNPSLFKDPKFVLIAASNLVGFLGFFVPFLYLPSLASSKEGVSAEEAAILLSVIGISNTVGRIVCGYISDFAWVDPLVVTNISFMLTGNDKFVRMLSWIMLICSGISILIFPLLEGFTEFITISLMFGVSIAALITLTSIVLVDVLGLESLTSAFGMLIMFRGLATIMGPPIAGMVYEAFGSYSMSFNVAGAFLLVAGAVSITADFVRRRQRQSRTEQC